MKENVEEKKNLNGNKKIFFLIIFLVGFLFQNKGFSQTIITGSVKNRDSVNLSSVNVILQDSLSKEIISYTSSDQQGLFEIKTNQKDKIALIFSSIGYETKTTFLSLNKKQKEIDIVLKEKLTELDEVLVQTEKPFSIKKDTISFKTKFYTRGTEQTVEDLLKSIPGLNIDAEGIIKVGNQEIEKLLIDDDDFFGKGYKILSKNMPAYPIEEVEILKRYSNNKLLKGVEESDKVALNLKLDEKAKRVWFGNIEAGLGNDSFYQFKTNLMNFGKKNKYYFLTNFNNTGYDATGDLDHLIHPLKFDDSGDIGDDQKQSVLLNLNPDELDFKRSRINFNKAKLISLNTIFKPNDKLKVKPLVFLNWDKNDFFRDRIDDVALEDESFINTEDYQLHQKKRIAFGKLDITYDITENQMLKAETKYNYANYHDGADLIFNDQSIFEKLKHQNTSFDQKINYTNKFKEKKVFILTSRFIKEQTPQNYNINRFNFQELFLTDTLVNNIAQDVDNKMQYVGFNAHLMDRFENGDLLELQIGNEYRKDKLTSHFALLEDEIILNQPEAYQNDLNYQANDLYLKSKYRLKINNFGITGRLDFHQLFNRLKNEQNPATQTPFFINPSLGFDWKINENNKIISSYSYNTTQTKILDVYDNFVLTGFRAFQKGTGKFDQLNASNFMLNYQLGNWSNRFFANTFIIYNKKHDYFSTNSLISQNYTQAEKIRIKNQDFINVNSTLDYYLKSLSSNLKLDLGYHQIDFENMVNSSDLRKVKNKNYQYGLEWRSGFQSMFNFHLGTKWTTSIVKSTNIYSFTDNFSFLDLIFKINNKFNIQVQTERYYFGNLETDKAYYFMDFEMRYKLIESKLNLSLSGQNLFNTKTFKKYSISDIGTSITSYRLLPRYVLLKIEYRF